MFKNNNGVPKTERMWYFPFSLTKIHYYFNPKYFFRESQVIRLFIWIFTQVEDKKTRVFFEEAFKELESTNHGLFDRLYKSDIELFAQLINSNTNLLRSGCKHSEETYIYSLDIMRGLERHLSLLERKRCFWILERVFSQNPNFTLWLAGFSSELARHYDSKYKK